MNETAELFFLERVANKLVEEYGANLYKTTIVLPSNRAKSYFSKYLFDIAGKPILLPNLVQMSQWVQQLSGYTTANKMSLILLVYEAYTNVVKNPEPFEIFTKWGITALDDFNQIDSSLVQSSELFKNLRDIKDIESWSFDSDELAESQIQFENFWMQLGEVYYEFIRLQEERKQFSYARINRLMAENKIASCEDEVVIVGLSSFSIAEEKWLNDLNKKGNIHFEFDADCYYVNNPQHEAGIFFRKWEKAGHSFSKSNDFEKFKREITISKVVTPLASAFAAAKLVNEMSPQEREGCAVVLTQP
ncbi:MAG: hypothetical protein ACKO8Q_07615, partial [Bacteroidota bacterium]